MVQLTGQAALELLDAARFTPRADEDPIVEDYGSHIKVLLRIMLDDVEHRHIVRLHRCAGGCGSFDVEMRHSLGIQVSEYCDPCWDASGFRKEGKEGYSYLDAGEHYDEEDY